MNLPIILSEKEAFEKLRLIDQTHLISRWDHLDASQKENLLWQITRLDIDFFRRLQAELQKKAPETYVDVKPFKESFLSGNSEDQKLGKELAGQGKCACLILAGGQGSRLRCEGPKGCFPTTLVKKKSLFQLVVEKVKAAGKQVGKPLQIGIMTSPLNHVETELFFVQNGFFGLNPSQVTFFFQRMWPLLDLQGNLFLQAPDMIARGPNGNGGVFKRMVEIGLWEKWKEMGIETVNVLTIDNPLALPIDYELLGFHSRQKCDVSIKATIRENLEEKVGVMGQVDGKTVVLEYSEYQTDANFNIAHLGLYCVSMPFIQHVSQVEMPLHYAKKAVKTLDVATIPEEPNAWKFEEFIFDILPFTSHCEALLYPRESCFAPLKSLKGEGSITSVHEALLSSDRKIFKQVTGVEPPSEAAFELAPEFYYPTAEFLEKWKGKSLPEESYIA